MGQTQVKKNNKDLSSYRGEKHKLNTSESAHTINHGGLSFVLKSKAIHQKEQRKKNKGMLEGLRRSMYGQIYTGSNWVKW